MGLGGLHSYCDGLPKGVGEFVALLSKDIVLQAGKLFKKRIVGSRRWFQALKERDTFSFWIHSIVAILYKCRCTTKKKFR